MNFCSVATMALFKQSVNRYFVSVERIGACDGYYCSNGMKKTEKTMFIIIQIEFNDAWNL